MWIRCSWSRRQYQIQASWLVWVPLRSREPLSRSRTLWEPSRILLPPAAPSRRDSTLSQMLLASLTIKKWLNPLDCSLCYSSERSFIFLRWRWWYRTRNSSAKHGEWQSCTWGCASLFWLWLMGGIHPSDTWCPLALV